MFDNLAVIFLAAATAVQSWQLTRLRNHVNNLVVWDLEDLDSATDQD